MSIQSYLITDLTNKPNPEPADLFYYMDAATGDFVNISYAQLSAAMQFAVFGAKFVTDNSVDASKSFVIDGTAGDITVDWGDGVTETQTMGSGAITFNHTYSGTGINTGYIRGALANITHFTASDCELNSIEIDQMSALEVLDLQINNLTGIDISKNIALRIISLENNQLTNIDTSLNINLTELVISTNIGITVIDISTNILLESFQCAGNPITEIDISKNILLTSIYLFGCAISNQLNIDDILTLAAAAGLAINVIVSGGTNAAPSTADGVPPISTIVANGGSVTHN